MRIYLLTPSESRRMKKTSIIITCHNYGRYLSWCVNSALHQTEPPKEIVLINDGSTDETEVIADSFGDQIIYYKVSFGDVQKARNFGVAKASGEYVLLLDADNYLDNYALEIMQRELDNDPDLKLVYSDRFKFGSPETIASKRRFAYYREAPEFDVERLRYCNFIDTSALVRRRHFPIFDPRIRRNQDWDAWLGILTKNTEAKRIPMPLLSYRWHGQNKTFKEELFFQRLKIMLKHKLIQPGIFDSDGEADGVIGKKRVSLSIVVHGSIPASYRHLVNFVNSNPIDVRSLWILCCKDSMFVVDKLRKVFPRLHYIEFDSESPGECIGYLSRKGTDEVLSSDAVMIGDFSDSIRNINFEVLASPEPRACLATPDLDVFLSARSWNDVGPVILNRAAFRDLFYLRGHAVPNNVLEKLAMTLKKGVDRRLLWRFK
jgi:glycosyltransferase involved in cell wall biosynthesis